VSTHINVQVTRDLLKHVAPGNRTVIRGNVPGPVMWSFGKFGSIIPGGLRAFGNITARGIEAISIATDHRAKQAF